MPQWVTNKNGAVSECATCVGNSYLDCNSSKTTVKSYTNHYHLHFCVHPVCTCHFTCSCIFLGNADGWLKILDKSFMSHHNFWFSGFFVNHFREHVIPHMFGWDCW